MLPVQILSMTALLTRLCQKYSIPMNLKNEEELFESSDAVRICAGIFTHAIARKDEFDKPMIRSTNSVMKARMSVFFGGGEFAKSNESL